MHVLDNPVWHALTGPQATVAEHRSRAARFDPAVAPFAAIPDEPSPNAWDDLADLVGPGGAAVLLREPQTPPSGWEEVVRIATVQMVATSVEAAASDGTEPLGPDDVPAMLALVGQTHPGPFESRTIELGSYRGVRDDGELVAMAGERMHLPGYVEISAVCTAPTHQRRGLASTLVRDLVARIEAGGSTAVLHAVTTNEPAIRVYEALGFTVRRQLEVAAYRRPPNSRS